MSQQTPKSSTVGIGIVIGAGIGILAGALFTGNVVTGWAIIIGAGLGVVIASIIDARRREGNDHGGDAGDE